MTTRLSNGLRNYTAKYGSLANALNGGKLLIYSGAQPSSAEAAPTGTLLCTITDTSGAHTAEVLSVGTVELTGGASGSVDTLTVNSVDILGGAVSFDTSLTITAAAVAAKINAFTGITDYKATSSGAIITIQALNGRGTAPNTFVVASTVTTITKTDSNMAGGVASANGLKFGAPASGVLGKLSTQTWSGVNAATGTAGWFRFVGPVADSGALDTVDQQIRLDGSIATSGSDLNLNSTAFTISATTGISQFNVTVPAA
jgi:hypothetical protein